MYQNFFRRTIMQLLFWITYHKFPITHYFLCLKLIQKLIKSAWTCKYNFDSYLIFNEILLTIKFKQIINVAMGNGQYHFSFKYKWTFYFILSITIGNLLSLGHPWHVVRSFFVHPKGWPNKNVVFFILYFGSMNGLKFWCLPPISKGILH